MEQQGQQRQQEQHREQQEEIRGQAKIFAPLERKSRSAAVFEALKGKIQSGFWKQGEKIYTEADLASAFNVGRSTVREALNRLKAANFIYTVPGLGTFVNAVQSPLYLDPENIRDVVQVMEFRVAYEPYCAFLAAERVTAPEIDALVQCVGRQEVNVASETDLSGFAEADMIFHSLIASATRNTLFSHSFDLIREHLLKQQVISASYAERRAKALAYHRQIIQAFRRRECRQAERVMREHVTETRNAISALLR
ncbi:MAG: FCD domain-containing protein [Synergistaceae bacterium]|jgi:GntR family transcriptional repressor for pyruvate dehydrogenase complex|nr:FCD domain-containing protein [Synergistaceae bacterium]